MRLAHMSSRPSSTRYTNVFYFLPVIEHFVDGGLVENFNFCWPAICRIRLHAQHGGPEKPLMLNLNYEFTDPE